MKFLIAMVVLALGVYLAAKQGYIKSEWLGGLSGSAPSTGEPKLGQVIKNINARLPRMLTPELSFDRVIASQQEMTFYYRFVDLDQATAMQRYAGTLQEFQNAIVQDVCGDKEIRQTVFDGGRSILVLLRSQDSKVVLSTTVGAEQCR